jgi:uncharacterized integral membrane protein
MRIVVAVLILVVAIALTVFSVENTQRVQLSFLGVRSETFPLSLVIVLSAIGGFLLMGLFWLQDVIRRGLRFRSEAKARSNAEKKVLDLEIQVAKLTEENNTLKGPAQPPLKEQQAGTTQR